MSPWPLQDAKNRLSEVVARAERDGPQIVTRRGAETAVVLSIKEYRRLLRAKPSFKAFLLAAPLAGAPLERDPDRGRPSKL